MKNFNAIFLFLLYTSTSFASQIDAARVEGDLKVNGIHFGGDSSTLYSSKGLLTDRGAWITGVAYSAGDVVQFGGSSYVASTANISIQPPNASYWSVLAAQGSQGIQGPKGDAGVSVPVTLDVICNAIISANKVLPSYCSSLTLTSISVIPKGSSSSLNSTKQFSIVGTLSDSSAQDLTKLAIWNSSNQSVATISNGAGSNGMATTLSAGTTTISATYGNFSDATNFNVNATMISINEYSVPTVSGGPTGISAGTDGNLWFIERDGNKIGRITPAGVITEFSIPTVSSNSNIITKGPGSNLWFTELSGNKIGKITPAGVITEFPVPTVNSGPIGIVAGTDGNLWFTENSGNKIGRMTPAGVFAEFPVPTGGSSPYGISAGSDGNLWFTENSGNKIGRITTVGVITEFDVPTGGSYPFGITAGPDGNLWFVEYFGNKIGRITTAGVITEFDVPTGGSYPFGITAGPDGNLWFTENSGNKLGRITPAGVITEFEVPTGDSYPYGITAGPDGNLWFTEYFGNKIGRVLP